jgi:DNA-binding NarL/FixJ family response regulator
MNKQISITIIDDVEYLRSGLKDMLSKLEKYKVVEEFENGVQFIKSLHKTRYYSDIYIIDYSMPGLDGIETVKKALELNPDLQFLFLSQNFDEKLINKAYNAGARGYLNKSSKAHELEAALENIRKTGFTNISEVLKHVRNQKVSVGVLDSEVELSQKELKLLELVCDEKEFTYEDIASKMNISRKTVDHYRGKLFAKLQVKSKVGLVLYSHKYKITPPFKD